MGSGGNCVAPRGWAGMLAGNGEGSRMSRWRRDGAAGAPISDM